MKPISATCVRVWATCSRRQNGAGPSKKPEARTRSGFIRFSRTERRRCSTRRLSPALTFPATRTPFAKSTRAALAVFARPGLGRFLGHGPAAGEPGTAGTGRDQGRLLRAAPDPGRGDRPARRGIAPSRPGGQAAAPQPRYITSDGPIIWPGVAMQSAAEREDAAAKSLPVSSALDHFLTGKEQYKRGDFRGGTIAL